ncbi:transposase, partial [Listeria monocytogenes]|nr:transposase [Listeria monocytogenes]
MKKENIAVRVIMEELGIKNKTQIETWWRWYRNGEEHRLVQRICIANHFRYGYRKITALMNRERRVSKNTIQRIMQKNNWQCRVKIKKKKRTGQPYPLYDNIL